MRCTALQGPHSSLKVRGLNGELTQIKNGGLGLPPESIFEIAPRGRSENSPFNRYLLLYTYIYIQPGFEETLTSIKTDTHQNFHDMSHFLTNQNEKGTIYWGANHLGSISFP